ncbi:GntR family transcriptional regulator [Sinorhizobium meliloti]|uniref:GntR family transcriptional regulator n=1 Tax=Rhizobium meliloti TaxID=382 RepID=UPI0003703085|nr:GntR family transcriptional regulator [Sinorhizobium meliloti]
MWFCERMAQCHEIIVPEVSFERAAKAKSCLAYEAVLQLLYSYAHVPGQHLNEKDLAAKLNIGRTPVREALIRLAAEGKIICLPQRGYFTKPLIEWVLLDAYVIARELLILALTRNRSSSSIRLIPCDQLSPDELAHQAESIFTQIAQGASNCELCQMIDKFCFSSRPVRLEIAASELSASFRRSLATLMDAMRHLNNGKGVVESALAAHLDLEQSALPGVVHRVNTRLTSLPFVTYSNFA